MLGHGMFFVLACLACWSISSASVCTSTTSKSVSRTTYEDCGWWGWGSCTKVVYSTVYELQQTCCPGSYGTVASKCNGECPYSASSKSSLCTTGTGTCRDYMCDKSGFESKPTSVEINENNNAAVLLWSTQGTSFVQNRQGSERTSKNVPSTNCSVVSTNGIAEVRDGTHIYRKACTNPTCSSCGISDVGCLDSSLTYYVTVSCYAPGYTNTGKIQHTFVIDVEKAEPVEFGLSEDEYDEDIVVDSDMSIGDVVLTLDNIETPSGESGVEFELKSPTSNITGEPFFKWDGDSHQVEVASDLSQEASGTYTVTLCASQRRGSTCIAFEVTFERITTTTTTTTPTTTSTTPSTTTTPEVIEQYVCQAVGIWKTIRGFDRWCDSVCKDNAVDCLYVPTFCGCLNVEDKRINCTSVGYWASKDMDAWCFLSCNYGDYSHCPTKEENELAYCNCE